MHVASGDGRPSKERDFSSEMFRWLQEILALGQDTDYQTTIITIRRVRMPTTAAGVAETLQLWPPTLENSGLSPHKPGCQSLSHHGPWGDPRKQ